MHRGSQPAMLVAVVGLTASAAIAGPPLGHDFNDGSTAGWMTSDPLASPFGPTSFGVIDGRYTITSVNLPPLPVFVGAGTLVQDSINNPSLYTNGTVRATIRLNNSSTNAFLAMRTTPQATVGYNFFLNNVQNAIGIDDLSTPAPNIAIAPFQLDDGVDYRVEAKALGDDLSIKVWKTTDAEPDQPQVIVNDSNARADGNVGFVVYNQTNTPGGLSGAFDDFTFTPAGWDLMDDFATRGLSDWSLVDLTTSGVGQASAQNGVALMSTSAPVSGVEAVGISYNPSAESPLAYADGTVRFLARAGNNRSALDPVARMTADGLTGLAGGFYPTNGQMFLGEYVGDNTTLLGSATIPVAGFETADWYLEFSFHGDRLSLKAWPFGTAEPAQPQVVASGATISAAGLVGLGVERVGTTGLIEAACLDAWFKPISCRADINGDGSTTSQDFFDFVTAFFAGSAAADFNHDGTVNSQDFFDFLAVFFAGCD
ncbi:MAG: GC-type dockerin domain-anchored protein [Phycisphaerales bacterium]